MKFGYKGLACAVVLSTLSLTTFADITKNPAGLYLQGNLGAGTDGWKQWQHSTLQYPDWSSSNTTDQVKNRFLFAFGGTIGYSFNDKFAIQAEYHRMLRNRVTFGGTAIRTSQNDGAFVGQMSMPVANIYIDAVAGMGVIHNYAPAPLNTHTQWVPVIGLGDHMMISKHVSAGIAYRYFMSVAQLNKTSWTPSHQYLTFSLGWHFGDRAIDSNAPLAGEGTTSAAVAKPSESEVTQHNNGMIEVS